MSGHSFHLQKVPSRATFFQNRAVIFFIVTDRIKIVLPIVLPAHPIDCRKYGVSGHIRGVSPADNNVSGRIRENPRQIITSEGIEAAGAEPMTIKDAG